jgi:GAF domain-containing protein
VTGSNPQPSSRRPGAGLPNALPRVPAPADRAAEHRHELISALARNVTARLDLADVLSATLAELRTLLPFGGGSIQLVDDDGWIRLAATDPAGPDDLFDVRIPLESTVAGRIVLTERPVYLPDIHAEEVLTTPPPRKNLSPNGVRSYFGVPLLAEGRAIGVLQVDSPEPAAWDEMERMLVVCIAPIVAAAIQNARSHARVNAMQRNTKRIVERWRVISQLLETDVDTSLRGLVEMSESEPSLRDQVDRLTIGIACVRAVASAEHDIPSSAAVDLRSAHPTRA